ncbi:PREDICTED: guanylate-binding protein 1-like [Calidris pugnax]|uniref:guanylate-binding protein 1-like n=1 Tax=Calidris pugnax TaxID=198806 RepID=UPI00071CADC0|nr:PREDICTED: guanylate-binding protein 1-like [Calidris pugnax]
MASEILMPEPLCLVENHPRKGLVVQQEALQVLSEVTQPVVVVAITGLYRTGKSYLMNRLAGRRKGFSLGSSVQSHTKGVWMWCLPHPRKPGHALVLLDTEGLGDVEKGDTENDNWIFVLTLLLSSTLIYNSRGTIDQQAMEQLHYVMKLTEQVRLKAAPGQSEEEQEEDPAEVAPFFPAFVWTVRDFTLRLEVDGEGISEDQYLEKALAVKAGTSSKIRRYNQPRECIRQYFWDRKCFVFDQPAPKRDLEHLEELRDDEIDPKFQQQVEKFCSHIWENSPPKTTPGGRIIKGSFEVNAAAVKEAVKFYQDLMEQRVKLPTETVEELLDLHSQCQQETQELFQKRAFEEDICSFQADLTRQVEDIKEKFLRDNEQESSYKCKAALGDLSRDVDRKLKDGVYNVPGGYKLFKGDLQALVEKYQEVPGKGVMAEAVLQEFLQSREDLDEIILKTDRALAEKEEELKRVREQQERAEEERKTREKEEAEEKQKLQDQVRSLEEESLRLRQELEEGSRRWREEHLRTGGRKAKVPHGTGQVWGSQARAHRRGRGCSDGCDGGDGQFQGGLP